MKKPNVTTRKGPEAGKTAPAGQIIGPGVVKRDKKAQETPAGQPAETADYQPSEQVWRRR